MDRDQRIVADGPERIRAAQSYARAVATVEREVDALFQERLLAAGAIHRVLLRVARAREIRRRVSKLAPREALYARTSAS